MGRLYVEYRIFSFALPLFCLFLLPVCDLFSIFALVSKLIEYGKTKETS